jgi:hypothetical protein
MVRLVIVIACVILVAPAWAADGEILGTGLCWPTCDPTPGALPNGSCGLQLGERRKGCVPMKVEKKPVAPKDAVAPAAKAAAKTKAAPKAD